MPSRPGEGDSRRLPYLSRYVVYRPYDDCVSFRPFRGTAVTTAAIVAAAVSTAFMPPAHTASAAPITQTARFATQGWVGTTHASATLRRCPTPAACATSDGSDGVATHIVTASTDILTIPAQARIDWAGLYWATTATATDPISSHATITFDGSDATSVTALSVSRAPSATGGASHQAFADISTLLRPFGQRSDAVQLLTEVSDAEVGAPEGGIPPETPTAEPTPMPDPAPTEPVAPATVASWAIVAAYSFVDGPDPVFAPTYSAISIHDGIGATSTGSVELIRVGSAPTAGPTSATVAATPAATPRATPAAGAPVGTVEAALLTSGAPMALRVGRATARPDTTRPGGYHWLTAPLPPAATPGPTIASAGLPSGRLTVVAAVVTVRRPMSVHIDLTLTAAITPDLVRVGEGSRLVLTLRNDADVAATKVEVTASLPAGTTLIAPVADYDHTTGVWRVGHVAADATATLILRVRVDRPGPLTSSAEVTAASLPDVDSTPGDRVTTQDDQAGLTFTGATPAAAGAAAAGDVHDGGWPRLQPALLFGIGLCLLGLLMLLVALLRHP